MSFAMVHWSIAPPHRRGLSSLHYTIMVTRYFPILERAANWEEIANARPNGDESTSRRFIDSGHIGSSTVTKLLAAFTTLEQLCNATLRDLERAPKITANTAWNIASFFSPDVRYEELWDPKKKEWVKLYKPPILCKELSGMPFRRLTQDERLKFRLSDKEIAERKLVKVKPNTRCVNCVNPLTGKQKKWCSQKCFDAGCYQRSRDKSRRDR